MIRATMRRRAIRTVAALSVAGTIPVALTLPSAEAGDLAPPPTATPTSSTPRTTTTTTGVPTIPPIVVAVPPTTQPPRRDTEPIDPGEPAPPAQVVTTSATTPAVIAQQPPTTQPATTVPSLVAVAPEEVVDEPMPIGAWSTEPGDWSSDVLDYLATEGVDIGTLGDQAPGDINDLLSNEGCAVNCITSGLAHAVGVGVYLEVTTSVPAFIQIEILDVGLKFGPPSAKVFGHTWADLEPGTTYQAVARAHDAAGNMAVAAGEFTTLQRQATITFEPTVLWFGNVPAWDPWGDYDFQLEAEAFLDGQSQAGAIGAVAPLQDILPTAAALGLTFGTGTIESSVIEVAYAGAYRCVDGCEDPHSDLDQAVPPWNEDANGSAENALFWGTVANGIELDGYPDDATSWTGHEFTFALSTFFGESVGPPVYLTVDVTVEVSYTQ